MANERQTNEKQVLELIATDRLYIPLSSLGQKLKRTRSKIAKEIAGIVGTEGYDGERFHAEVVEDDKEKARGMRDAVEEFKRLYPSQGRILEGMIDEKRTVREKHLEFGMQPGKRLAADDYLDVMKSIGFTEQTARAMYPDLMQVSYSLQKKRNFEQRSIIVGGESEDSDSE